MNLDDFIVSNSTASPASLTPPTIERTAHRTSAVAIKTKKGTEDNASATLMPGSVPQPLPQSGRANEFDYVEKRVRKTSVDERRVSRHEEHGSMALSSPRVLTCLIRLENVLLNSRLKYLPQLFR